MAKRVRDKDGKLKWIEFDLNEFAKILDVSPEQLLNWKELVPVSKGKAEKSIYKIKDKNTIEMYQKRLSIAKTMMSSEAIINLEKGGFLDAYANLAVDCPTGLTAHVWRSYGLIVLIQIRYGKKIGVEELSQRAKIMKKDGKREIPDLETAEKHIRLLAGLGYLVEDDSPEWAGQWRHKGLPAKWAKEI